jgi:F-type H+-transporting ATPase subunit b
MVAFHLLAAEVLAADNPANWRPVFDLVMRWLNFGIIVFVLVKYARRPLKDFLLSRREELAREIEKIEQKKQEANQKIHEATQMMEESEDRFNQIKARIIREGEKRKQQIIESAHREKDILLEAATRKIENQLFEAKSAFKSELVDRAVSLAMQRLPEEITAEDERQLINQFVAGAAAK